MSKNNNLKDIYKVLSWLSSQRTPPAPVAEAMARLQTAAGLDQDHQPPESTASQFRDGVRQWGPTGKLYEANNGQWVEVS